MKNFSTHHIMSLKYTILGFLSFKPLTGYELKKGFDQSVRHFWPADQSQIYRTLKQLHKDNLISQEVIPREDRLDMKVYSVTDAGEALLKDWLSTPLPPSDAREPFLIQIYFAFMLQDDQVVRLLQAEIDQISSLLETFEQVYHMAAQSDRPEAHKRPYFYSMLTLEYGVQANVWYRNWLQGLLERVESGDIEVLPFDALIGRVPPSK